MFFLVLSLFLAGCWLLVVPALGGFEDGPVRVAAGLQGSLQGGPSVPLFFILPSCRGGDVCRTVVQGLDDS